MENVFEIAADISTPLALSGLLAAILFFVLRKILEKDIFPSLTKSAGADVIKLIIERLFVLALVAMVLGFAGYVVSLTHTAPQKPIVEKISLENTRTTKYVFVTSQKVNSSFGGLATADLICNKLASKAGLGGDFKSWLSDSNVGPVDRFSTNSSTYVLPSKKIVVENLKDLLDCSNSDNCLKAPINENENGIPVSRPHVNSPENRIWTATQPNGLPVGNNCKNWSSELPKPNKGLNDTVVTLGDPTSIGASWTSSYSANCNDLELSFYCFEQ